MTLLEGRKADRVRTLLRARILFNNQNSTIDCTIKNISGAGAKIELSNSTTIPNEFDLEIPARHQWLRARIMWRDADAVGVQFIEKAPKSEQMPMPSDTIERLELEVRKLRATNAILTKRLEDLGQDTSLYVH